MLAIHWGPEDYPSTPIVNASIQRALRSDPDIQIDYFAEYLESDAFAGGSGIPGARRLHSPEISRPAHRRRDRDRRSGVAVRAGSPRRAVSRRADRVFGRRRPADSRRGAARGLTAVLRGVAYGETLKLALALHPSTEQVFVVAGMRIARSSTR